MAYAILAGMRRLGLVAVVGLVLAGCGSSALDGSAGRGTSAGQSVVLGQEADFSAYLINRSDQTVTLESAKLIPEPGFRTPRQGHFAVEGKDYIANDVGWPPAGAPGWMFAPFSGHKIGPHQRVEVLYTTVADVPGDYAVKGVRIVSRVGGSEQTTDALGASLTCVFAPAGKHEPPSCPARDIKRLQDAT